ncbi:MAG: DUF3368 domain-containing protein, partial [Candidatus Aminicenantales bacterium]
VAARSLGLEPVGVLGVLLRARREGRIAALEPVPLSLRNEAGFFIADALFNAILAEAGEG